MKLASFLNPALIFCELAGETREEIYRNMLTQAQGQLREKIDVGQVAGAMIAREDNLRIPYDGVALPHLRFARRDPLARTDGGAHAAIRRRSA